MPVEMTAAPMSDQPPPVPKMLAAMSAAIEEALQFRGATAPNPPVGCAILDRDGRMLALAAHRRAGTPHAEAAALACCRADGTVDRIHTFVVTLEPCNHWGRTPPCTEAILSTSAQRVVLGVPDPNPAVDGGGAARLRAEGVRVDTVEALRDEALAARCAALVAPFRKLTLTGRPWVTVKQALDSSGSMIPPPGFKTFTSPAALRFAHALRRRADAIVTGSGTVLADDPHFTVRHLPDHEARRRLLAILDRRRRVPRAYREAADGRGFVVISVDGLEEVLDRLGSGGALEVLVEAGPGVTASMLSTDLWDEHVVIRRGAGSGGADRAEIVRRGVAGNELLDLA